MISIIMLAALLLTAVISILPEAHAAFENTYVNTGNQAEDLIGVAMTQVGYNEGERNDTKYGDWMGYPNQAWCAMFISWCAEQAEIPTTVLNPSAWAHPRKGRGFNVPCYHGTEYTPKRGDLFFKEDFSHVGIVYGVEGEYALTIEANTNDDGSAEGYTVLLRKRKISESYFGVPRYRTCGEGHSYTIKYEPGHPHKRYYYCTTCRKSFYTGGKELVLSCSLCMKCSCSTGRSGYYKVRTDGGRLRVYSNHKAKTILGYLENDELVYVEAANYTWAHIIYARTPGSIRMSYLERYVHPASELAADQASYYQADTAELSWHPSISATDYILSVSKDGEALTSLSTNGATSWNLENLAPGSYNVQVQGSDGIAISEAVTCDFTVLPTYQITLDAADGTGTQEQIKLYDQALVLTDKIPQKSGYNFLGWNMEPNAKHATYEPGQLWRLNRDTCLYAVWQEANAVPTNLQILTAPTQTVLVAGQEPDPAGMVLMLTYSDGTYVWITEGYTLQADEGITGEGFVTVQYAGISARYPVLFLPLRLDHGSGIQDVMEMLK